MLISSSCQNNNNLLLSIFNNTYRFSKLIAKNEIKSYDGIVGGRGGELPREHAQISSGHLLVWNKLFCYIGIHYINVQG